MSKAAHGPPFEETVEDVLDSAPCGFISTLPDGTITQVNETFLSWTGRSRAALLAGQRFQDLLTIPNRIFYDAHFAPLLQMQMQGFVQKIACQIRREGQEPLPVLVNSSLKLDADGLPLFIRTIVFDASDRTKHEEELRRARNEAQQLAAIVAASGDAIISLGLDLVVRTWNPGATQLFGYAQDEAVGRSIDELIVPEDRLAERAGIYDTVRTGAKATKQTTRRHKNGSLVGVEFTASPICDAEGQIMAISVVYQDIAERDVAGDALRRSEIRYRRLFEAAHDGVLILDPSTRKIVDANPFMTRLLGYTRDQLVGMELYEIGFLADAQASRDMFEVLKVEHQVRYESLPLQNQDGNLREVEVVANLYAENGHSVIQCNVRDITERKKAADALRLSESRLRAYLTATTDAVYRMSPDWSELLQLSGGGFIADTERPSKSWLNEYIDPDDQQQVRASILQAIESKGIFDLEHRVKRRDGRLGWTRSRAIPILDEWGMIIEWLGAASDITERKQAETELRESHDTYLRLIENNPFGVYLIDSDFRLAQASPSVKTAFGNIDPLIGRDFAEIVGTLWQEPIAGQIIASFRRTLETGEGFHSKDTTGQRANRDAEESYDWQIERVSLPGDRFGVVCYFYDLTERKRHERHVEFLMGEVNHRSRNLLAVVAAIAQQTARSADPSTFAIHLSARIRGLAASQELLVKNQWTHVELSELVHAQLSHFRDLIGTRVLINGPPINLPSSAAQGIGMALHELATNAAKYGALSNASGRVHISWGHIAVGKPGLTLQWLEEGGPEVISPIRKGFGDIVIGYMLKESVGGNVEIEYRKSGLYWKLTAPSLNLFSTEGHER